MNNNLKAKKILNISVLVITILILAVLPMTGIIISRENNVKFIFAVSPGIDLNYDGEKGEKDFDILMTKLNSIYEIGGRDFAIFFDDINADENSGKSSNFSK